MKSEGDESETLRSLGEFVRICLESCQILRMYRHLDWPAFADSLDHSSHALSYSHSAGARAVVFTLWCYFGLEPCGYCVCWSAGLFTVGRCYVFAFHRPGQTEGSERKKALFYVKMFEELV